MKGQEGRNVQKLNERTSNSRHLTEFITSVGLINISGHGILSHNACT